MVMFIFFFFKQKTAYEMRISDWSSDVCSSDLIVPRDLQTGAGSERNDVALAGLNHKMGQRGTVNTLLNFGEGRHSPGGQPGAIGYRVGSEGQGLGIM